jgi:hypothetical protein
MTIDILDVVGRMIVPATVITALALLRRYLPARKTDPQAQLDSHGYVEDFTYANTAVYAVMIAVGIAFAYLSHLTLVAANRHFAEVDGPAAFRLFPSTAIWWFFPGFGSLCLSWEITLFLWSLLAGGPKVHRFIDWTSEHAGFDSTRALRWMSLFIAIPIGIATLLAIPLHSSLRDKDIVVGHYATLVRQTFPYSQDERLVSVDGFRDRKGKFTPRAAIIIVFNNGSRWNSSDNRDFTREPDRGLAEFLQRKTGLVVEHYGTDAEVPHVRTRPLGANRESQP